MNALCKTDARKRDATNMQNDAQTEVKIHQKYMEKQKAKKHHEQLCKIEASESYMPGLTLGPGVPEEVRSFSRDSGSAFPLACNITKKTNIRQTTKNQSPRTVGDLTRT